MKNLFNIFLNIFPRRNSETNKQKAAKNSLFPQDIEELKELVIGISLSRGKSGGYKLLMDFVQSRRILSFEEMVTIYRKLYYLYFTDELAEVVCEKVKKEKDLFSKLSIQDLSFFMWKHGLYSVIDLFDNQIISNGGDKTASLKLLEEVKKTNLLMYSTDSSAVKSYIKYFSLADGKDLIDHPLSSESLKVINEKMKKNVAKKLVKKGKMSKELFEAVYN